MARGEKRCTENPSISRRPAAPECRPSATITAPGPRSEERAPTHPGSANLPRIATAEDPWRDLHPKRIWPD